MLKYYSLTYSLLKFAHLESSAPVLSNNRSCYSLTYYSLRIFVHITYGPVLSNYLGRSKNLKMTKRKATDWMLQQNTGRHQTASDEYRSVEKDATTAAGPPAAVASSFMAIHLLNPSDELTLDEMLLKLSFHPLSLLWLVRWAVGGRIGRSSAFYIQWAAVENDFFIRFFLLLGIFSSASSSSSSSSRTMTARQRQRQRQGKERDRERERYRDRDRVERYRQTETEHRARQRETERERTARHSEIHRGTERG